MEIMIEVRRTEADREVSLNRLEAYRKVVCEAEKKVNAKEEM